MYPLWLHTQGSRQKIGSTHGEDSSLLVCFSKAFPHCAVARPIKGAAAECVPRCGLVQILSPFFLITVRLCFSFEIIRRLTFNNRVPS